MFGSVVLEVAVGIAYLYLLLSVICSAVNEWLAGALALRARTLEAALRNLLNDPATINTISTTLLYRHPLVGGLSGTDRPPSYMPARVFATALLDLVAPADPAASPQSIQTLRSRITALPDGKIKGTLLPLINQAGNDLSQAQRNIEEWFNHAMDRVSGRYKRRTQIIVVVLAIAFSVALNADTLTIANRLVQSPALAAQAVTLAQQPNARVDEAFQQLQLPLGWTWDRHYPSDPRGFPSNLGGWIAKLLGLLFTAAAVSLGAPFWFDFVGRVVNLRASGTPPTSSASP